MNRVNIEKIKLDLAKTLRNNICCVQSLDRGRDRSRVKQEIIKMLKNSWHWKKRYPSYGYIKIK